MQWIIKKLTWPVFWVLAAFIGLWAFQIGVLGQTSAELAFKGNPRHALKEFRRYCYPSVQLWLVNGYDHDVCMSKVGEMVSAFDGGTIAAGGQDPNDILPDESAASPPKEETSHNAEMMEGTASRFKDVLDGKYKVEFKMP